MAARLTPSAASRGERRARAARRMGCRARRRGRPLRRLHSRPRPGQRRVLHLRPAPHRGLLRLQQARERIDRHQQHRYQFAAVHVERGGRLQADAGRRRAAGMLRGHRLRAVPVHRRVEHGVGAPDPVSPHRSGPRAQSRPQDHRRRSAQNGHGERRRPASGDRAGHRRRAVQRHAASPAVGRPGRSRVRRRAHVGLRCVEGDRARIHAAHRRGNLRHRRSRSRDRGALVRRRTHAIAVLPGAQPIVGGHREERGADQSPPRDRTNRQAGRGTVLAHRTAERDGRPRSGRHGEPAVRASRP